MVLDRPSSLSFVVCSRQASCSPRSGGIRRDVPSAVVDLNRSALRDEGSESYARQRHLLSYEFVLECASTQRGYVYTDTCAWLSLIDRFRPLKSRILCCPARDATKQVRSSPMNIFMQVR